MAANTSPIFPLTPNIGFASVLTANTALDGTGTVQTGFTAGANGSRVAKVTIQITGTSVATVLRLFVNNGSTNTTATNNSLYKEITLAANTLSQTAQQVQTNIIDFGADGLVLPATYKLNFTVGTTIANAASVTTEGGDY